MLQHESARAVRMNRASAATCLRTASRPAGAGTAAARLSSHVPWFVSAALSHVGRARHGAGRG